jgi:hypothetical protein
VWESATFSSIFLASSFSCSQTESTPAHTQVTHTVRQPSAKANPSLNRKFGFVVEFKKANLNLFSGGVGKFFFLVHVSSGFQIFGFINFAGLLNFRFCRRSKFWLIVACHYLAYFWSSQFGAGSFLSKVIFGQNQLSKISTISLVKGFDKFCSGWLVKFHSLAKVFFNWQSFCFTSVLVGCAFFGNCQKLSCV